eukprot:gene2126-1302_t
MPPYIPSPYFHPSSQDFDLFSPSLFSFNQGIYIYEEHPDSKVYVTHPSPLDLSLSLSLFHIMAHTCSKDLYIYIYIYNRKVIIPIQSEGAAFIGDQQTDKHSKDIVCLLPHSLFVCLEEINLVVKRCSCTEITLYLPIYFLPSSFAVHNRILRSVRTSLPFILSLSPPRWCRPQRKRSREGLMTAQAVLADLQAQLDGTGSPRSRSRTPNTQEKGSARRASHPPSPSTRVVAPPAGGTAAPHHPFAPRPASGLTTPRRSSVVPVQAPAPRQPPGCSGGSAVIPSHRPQGSTALTSGTVISLGGIFAANGPGRLQLIGSTATGGRLSGAASPPSAVDHVVSDQAQRKHIISMRPLATPSLDGHHSPPLVRCSSESFSRQPSQAAAGAAGSEGPTPLHPPSSAGHPPLLPALEFAQLHSGSNIRVERTASPVPTNSDAAPPLSGTDTAATCANETEAEPLAPLATAAASPSPGPAEVARPSGKGKGEAAVAAPSPAEAVKSSTSTRSHPRQATSRVNISRAAAAAAAKARAGGTTVRGTAAKARNRTPSSRPAPPGTPLSTRPSLSPSLGSRVSSSNAAAGSRGDRNSLSSATGSAGGGTTAPATARGRLSPHSSALHQQQLLKEQRRREIYAWNEKLRKEMNKDDSTADAAYSRIGLVELVVVVVGVRSVCVYFCVVFAGPHYKDIRLLEINWIFPSTKCHVSKMSLSISSADPSARQTTNRVLVATVVSPPRHSVNYLEALINTDPRAAFQPLHFGLLRLVDQREAGIKHAREGNDKEAQRIFRKARVESSSEEDDEAEEEEDIMVEDVPVELRHCSVASSGAMRTAPYLHLEGLHQAIAQRTPFQSDDKELAQLGALKTRAQYLEYLGKEVSSHIRVHKKKSAAIQEEINAEIDIP